MTLDTAISTMSEEQLSALLAKLKEDAVLQEKLKSAADPDAAVAIAKEAGFDLTKDDWLKAQGQQAVELSDEELEGVAGGYFTDGGCSMAGGCGSVWLTGLLLLAERV